jgi:hypothetical protein
MAAQATTPLQACKHFLSRCHGALNIFTLHILRRMRRADKACFVERGCKAYTVVQPSGCV